LAAAAETVGDEPWLALPADRFTELREDMHRASVETLEGGPLNPPSLVELLRYCNSFRTLCSCEFACAKAEIPVWFRIEYCERLVTC